MDVQIVYSPAPGPGGASPTVAQLTSITNQSYVSEQSFNLPSGITDGNEIFLIGESSNNLITLTTGPSGWTQVIDIYTGQGRMIIYQKTASSDSSASVSFTFSGATKFPAILLEVEGYTSHGLSTDTGSLVDPPSHDMGSSAETLWVAIQSWQRCYNVTAAPTNYSGLASSLSITPVSTSGNECAIAAAYRTTTAQTEDPDSFTYGTETLVSGAATMGIR